MRARLMKTLRVLAWSLLGLVLSVAFALGLLLGTQPGRDFVSGRGLALASKLIPGTLELDSLGRLSPWGLELSGLRARDPRGHVVLRLNAASLETNLPGLLSGKIAAQELKLHGAWVDLRHSGPGRGLLATFVDAAAPSSPAAGPPPPVRLQKVELSAIEVLLPELPEIGALDVTLHEALGSFELHAGIPSFTIERLKLDARRDGKLLARSELTASVPRTELPSQLDLRLSAAQMSLDLSVQGISPSHSGWSSQPARMDLSLQGVTPEHITTLLPQLALGDAFAGPVGVILTASGTPRDLVVEGAISTPGGDIAVTSASLTSDAASVTLVTKRLDLAQLRGDLPDAQLRGALRASILDWADGSPSLSVELDDASWDDVALPRLEARGTWSDDGLRDVSLELRDGPTSVMVSGEGGLSGAARLEATLDVHSSTLRRMGSLGGLDLRGRVQGRVAVLREPAGHLETSGALDGAELGVGDIAVDQLKLRFGARGKAPELSGEATLDLSAARVGEQHLDRATLRAVGGPNRFEIELAGSGGLGPPPESGSRPEARRSELDLSARVTRSVAATELTAQGRGQIAGHPYTLELAETTLGDAGGLRTEGITLHALGQRLVVRGAFGDRPRSLDEGLSIELERTVLDDLNGILALDSKLSGRGSLQARVAGTKDAPLLELAMRLERVRLDDSPATDLQLTANLDAKAGNASALVRARSGNALLAELAAALDFDAGPGFTDRLRESAEGSVELEVQRLDSNYLAAFFPPGTIPVVGTARASWKLEGTWDSPKLESSTALSLEQGEERVEVKTEASYQDAEWHLQLAVKDAQPFFRAEGELHLPQTPRSPQQHLALLRSAATDAEWRIFAQSQPRLLSQIPLSSLLVERPQGMPKVLVDLSVGAQHAPGAEPDLELRLHTSGRADGHEGSCGSQPFDATLTLRHRGEENQLDAAVRLDKKRALDLQASAKMALLPVLQGQTPSPRDVGFQIKSRRLDLAALPSACESFRGQISLEGEGSDLLGANPQARLRIDATEFSLGSVLRLDGEGSVLLNSRGAQLEASLFGRDRHAHARADVAVRVPFALSSGHLEISRDLPLDVTTKLSHLPVAPLLPPDGEISYATGTLDGRLAITGTVSSPRLDGVIELEDMSFTATSLAQPLRQVNGKLVLAGRRLEISHFEAHDRDGLLSLSGDVELEDMRDITARLEIQADQFPIRQLGQVVATTNLEASVHTRVTKELTSARLTLKNVDTWIEQAGIRKGIPLAHHPEFVVNGDVPEELQEELARARSEPHSGRAPAARSSGSTPTRGETPTSHPGKQPPEMGPPEQTEGRVHITIDARDRFWIKRSDFAVKLSTLLTAEIQGDNARIEGDVTIDRGYLQLFGKLFDLKKESQVRFVGNSPPNPVLEIEASHDTKSGRIVGVRITGRASDPQLTFLQDDAEVDASVALSTLFGARQSGGDEKDASTQAQSFVAGLTSGLLATAARRELGAAAPVILIDPAEAAGEGRIRAGFELDELLPPFLRPIITGVYLEGIVARESDGAESAETSWGTLLEVYFPRNFFAAGQYGPGTTWSLDFGWQL